MSELILTTLQQWAPFRIDALGLVTILGAEEAGLALGQLTQNRFTDWLPMLGAYIIANNLITEPLPSFALYNITDGIVATDLAGWFARWLLCQEFTFCSSTVHISARVKPRRLPRGNDICAYALGTLTLVPLIFSVLINDWWGLANGISMLVSVAVRQIVQGQNRTAIDLAVDESEKTSCEDVKVFLTLPNGKAVTIQTTRGIVIDCLLTTPRPPNPKLYTVTRTVGWLAFGIHIISLGMATLFCQLLTVVLLICATVLAAWQVGTDREHVGRRMVLKQKDGRVPFRAAAYARLSLTPQEEDSMVLWNLFPHKTNDSWWNKYRKAKEAQDFESWDTVLGKSK